MGRKASAESLPLFGKADTADRFDPKATSVILAGDSAETLKSVPDRSVKLIITSPPYNIGKVYEQSTCRSKSLPGRPPFTD